MGKEVKIKIKDIAKLQFELEENAQTGDWFDLNQINNYDLSSVEQALQTKKQAVEEEWKKAWSAKTAKDAVNAFVNSSQYQALLNKNSDLELQLANKDKQFAIEKNDLNNVIKQNENAIQLKINQAIEQFKHSPEFLNLQQQLVNLRKENTQLQDKVNTEKDLAIKEFMQSDEYKQLNKTVSDLRVDNSLLREQAKQITDSAIKEFKKGQEYIDLQNELNALKEANIKLQEQKANAVAQYIASDDYKKITTELTNLKVSNEQLKSQNEQLQKDKKELVATEQIKIDNAALKQKEKIENDFFNNSDRVKELRSTIETLSKEKETINKELENFKFAQKTKTSKNIGEDLEQWIMQDYNDKLNMAFGSSAKFEKANEVIENAKPDFIFTIYQPTNNDEEDNNVQIGKVIIEAKNERFDTKEENRHKNSDFYKKLDSDREHNKGDFAVLVTNLEWNKEFSVYLAEGYKNMFVVRPEWLMSLLSLLRFIIVKQAKVNTDIEKNKQLKLDKDALRTKFEEFRDNLLNNALKNINTNLETIETCANSIRKEADKIVTTKQKIVDNYFKTIHNKIEAFSIDSMCRKIDKINKLESTLNSTKKLENTQEPISVNINDEYNSSSNE